LEKVYLGKVLTFTEKGRLALKRGSVGKEKGKTPTIPITRKRPFIWVGGRGKAHQYCSHE